MAALPFFWGFTGPIECEVVARQQSRMRQYPHGRTNYPEQLCARGARGSLTLSVGGLQTPVNEKRLSRRPASATLGFLSIPDHETVAEVFQLQQRRPRRLLSTFLPM